MISDKIIIVSTSSPEADMPKIINSVSELNLTIEAVEIKKSSLEDVFLKLTGRSIIQNLKENNV